MSDSTDISDAAGRAVSEVPDDPTHPFAATTPERVNAVVEAAQELLDTLRPSMLKPFSDPAYGDEIRVLGARIGFGALMTGAEAEWRISAKASGNPDGGEFVTGPCRSVLTHDVERLRAALVALAHLPRDRKGEDRLRHLADSAEAFLRYFNPFDMAEDKSQQWQSLMHEIDLARAALRKEPSDE